MDTSTSDWHHHHFQRDINAPKRAVEGKSDNSREIGNAACKVEFNKWGEKCKTKVIWTKKLEANAVKAVMVVKV